MKSRNCDCKSWKVNTPKIDSIAIISGLHGNEYDGERFIYCPWCGKELIEDKE